MAALIEHKFKVLLLGAGNVGKTSLVRNFVEKRFSEDYLPSIGANLFVKEFAVEVQKKKISVRLALWDIAGQELFRPMMPTYHKGARGAFFVADLTSPESFDTLAKWHADMKKNVAEDIPIVLLANKNDLPAAVEESEIEATATKLGASATFKTSAKVGENVIEAFAALTKAILERQAE